jgi:4-amino-4-deoxy-L-arabinose transferase-like glycosyltransferase
MQESPRPVRQRLNGTAVIWITGFAFTLLHIATSSRYGFHRDELLTYSNARHLDWCYVVYAPLTAWLARIELALFGTSLVGFRSLAAISVGLFAVFSGLIARELGGKRQAMLAAAFTASIAGPIFFAGTFLSYMSFDLLWWVIAAWCVARLLSTEDPRWFAGVGAALGLGMLTKYTIFFSAAGILIALILTPNRRYLRAPWFWYGVAIALVLVAPVIVWQIQHHFVALAWMKSIHARDISWGRTDWFLLNQLWRVTSPITIPLSFAGLWYLFATPAGKPFRMLGWMFVIPLVLFLIARGRDYYMAPAYPILLAAGAVWGESKLSGFSPRAQRSALRATWIAFAIGAMIIAALIVPVAPINSSWWRFANAANGGGFDMEIGWPEAAATVASVRDSLPTADRGGLGVLAGDEGSAGAINLYGRAYGLPEAISGMNSNWLRGYGNPPPQTVIAIGMDPEFLLSNFSACRPVARLTNQYGVVNETIGKYSTVYVCGPPVKGWPEFWKDFQYYG